GDAGKVRGNVPSPAGAVPLGRRGGRSGQQAPAPAQGARAAPAAPASAGAAAGSDVAEKRGENVQGRSGSLHRGHQHLERPRRQLLRQDGGHHVDMRWRMHAMTGHGGRMRFLTWHRDVVLILEREAQKEVPGFFVPFWQWNAPRPEWTATNGVPDWIAGFKPTVKIPPVATWLPNGQTVTVSRNPGSLAELQKITGMAPNLINIPKFIDYTTQLEDNPHNDVHNWCNGTMTDIHISPADPIFWLHHGEVDRLWSLWQADQRHQGLGPTFPPPGAPPDNGITAQDAFMDPFAPPN